MCKTEGVRTRDLADQISEDREFLTFFLGLYTDSPKSVIKIVENSRSQKFSEKLGIFGNFFHNLCWLDHWYEY